MSRLKRKHRTDIVYRGCGGITDAFDDSIKHLWRINDDEYDYIIETDEGIDWILIPTDRNSTISDLKDAIYNINKLITKYYLTYDY